MEIEGKLLAATRRDRSGALGKALWDSLLNVWTRHVLHGFLVGLSYCNTGQTSPGSGQGDW